MLVILAILPVAAPFKAMLNEKTVAQIIVIDLTGEVRFPIQIRLSGDWLHDAHAVNHLRVRVIQRIDIYRQAQPMLGNPGGVGNEAKIEGGGVVVLHGKLVVCVIFVNQADLFNGIFCFIELLENFQHVLAM